MIENERQQDDNDILKDILEWADALLMALVCVAIVFSFVFRVVGVEGESMVPTLNDGDRLIVWEVFYNPTPGDVVVLNKPNFTSKPFVKRIIASGGQTVFIDFQKGEVYVDDVLMEEIYINDKTYKDEGAVFPLVVPEGEVFVMGDNRNHSTDSRSDMIGTVDKRHIVGKVMLKISPISDFGLVANGLKN